jgi:hypothetical protein
MFYKLLLYGKLEAFILRCRLFFLTFEADSTTVLALPNMLDTGRTVLFNVFHCH